MDAGDLKSDPHVCRASPSDSSNHLPRLLLFFSLIARVAGYPKQSQGGRNADSAEQVPSPDSELYHWASAIKNE